MKIQNALMISVIKTKFGFFETLSEIHIIYKAMAMNRLAQVFFVIQVSVSFKMSWLWKSSINYVKI